MSFFTDVLGGMTGIGAGLSGIGGLLGSLFSNSSANKQLKAQQQENQLNRDFNAQQAQLNREFQVQMMDKENEYNDPTNVVSRLQRAGINPAVAFGQFANGSSAASGSQASFSGGVGTSLPDWTGLSSPGNSILQSEMTKAQIRLADSQSRKLDSETDWMQVLNDDIHKLNSVGIDIAINTRDMQPTQAKLLSAELNNIEQTFVNLKDIHSINEQMIRQATSDANIKAVSAKYAESKEIAFLKQMEENTKLSRAQCVDILSTLSARIQKLQSESRLNDALSSESEFRSLINDAIKLHHGQYDIADSIIAAAEASQEKDQSWRSIMEYQAEKGSSNTSVIGLSGLASTFVSAGLLFLGRGVPSTTRLP